MLTYNQITVPAINICIFSSNPDYRFPMILENSMVRLTPSEYRNRNIFLKVLSSEMDPAEIRLLTWTVPLTSYVTLCSSTGICVRYKIHF
jgi:hypothetical protein